MRKLNELEKKWIDYIFKADFRDKDILLNQLKESLVNPTYDTGFISIRFVEPKGEKYPHNVRVPVEMRAFQKEMAPIVFLIHVIEGYINELEIYSADGAEIYSDAISLDALEYVIDPMVQLKEEM